MLKHIFVLLHQYGFASLIYTMMMHFYKAILMNNVNKMLIQLCRCSIKRGLLYILKNLCLNQFRKKAFLGFLIDFIKMIVTLTPEKASELSKLCAETIRKREITIRVCARIIGKMIAAEPAVQYAPLHKIVLENEKEQCLKSKKGNFDAKITLSEIAKSELNW